MRKSQIIDSHISQAEEFGMCPMANGDTLKLKIFKQDDNMSHLCFRKFAVVEVGWVPWGLKIKAGRFIRRVLMQSKEQN